MLAAASRASLQPRSPLLPGTSRQWVSSLGSVFIDLTLLLLCQLISQDCLLSLITDRTLDNVYLVSRSVIFWVSLPALALSRRRDGFRSRAPRGTV